MDRQERDEGVRAQVEVHQAPIKREADSLDDFEHLGHDSSPLKEPPRPGEEPAGSPGAGALIDNTGTEPAAKAADVAVRFDRPAAPHIPDDHPEMDTNLLQMGDSLTEKREDKLDRFLGDASPDRNKADREKEVGDFKAATRDFVEAERAQPLPEKEEVLERYSDSEPETEEVKEKREEAFRDVEEVTEAAPKEVEKPKEAPKPEPVKKAAEEVEKVAEEAKKAVEAKRAVEETKKVVEEVEEVEEVKKTEKVEEKRKSEVIEAEAMFCKMGLDAWFNPERLNPKVESLIYWRDPKKTGPIFGGVLVVLLALTYFSFISVAAYLSLIVLTGTISFRIYKNIVQAVQKTGDGHPFKEFLEFDISLSQDKVKEISEVAVSHINAAVTELRRLFLVEDLVDSIKFGVLLWCLTYLGSWFNGMTLIIIAWVALFTLPKVYEANKTQIDKNLEIVRTKLAEITSKVKAAIPIGKKAEEKKDQ